MNDVWLTLSDGTSWLGKSDDRVPEVEGEVVFTTANSGYPQAISDPSFKGQMIIFAFPPVGIYGVDTSNLEGLRPWATAVLVQHLENTPDEGTVQLKEWLKKYNIPLIHDLDTRNLILKFREKGTLMGRLADDVKPPSLQSLPETLVDEVSTDEIVTSGEGSRTIGILDLGVKRNIIRELSGRDCKVTLFPSSTDADTLLSSGLDGLVLSNGPGDPSVLEDQVAKVRKLLGKIPLFGICLGTQILALSCGAKTSKLPYGHRGANQPVLQTCSGRAYVTSQNHGYAIVEDSLEDTGLEIIFRHLSDGTVEGISHRDFCAWGVQFHPEANPGPWDARELFDIFLEMTGRNDR